MNILIHGVRCAMGPEESIQATIEVARGRIAHIWDSSVPCTPLNIGFAHIDLSGFLILPGLINAHDHLQFALFPRMANPPYRNYVDWGEDIHKSFPELIALHKSVPRHVRLWWGGIRNLLCGVTTVCHHDPLWPELQDSDFPIQVLRRYGWAHSPVLGGHLREARAATPRGGPFIIHACEGVDERSKMELWQLHRQNLLDADTVLVHALALDPEGAALVRKRNASIILCPSSNQFLFGKSPDMSLLSDIEHLALGNDSPLTAVGDLLDEVRFATRACSLSNRTAYRMVTTAPAAILRLNNAKGLITTSGAADLIAVRDTGDSPADRLQKLSAVDVELAMIRGRVQLSSQVIFERLPASIEKGLRPIAINGIRRWLRAPALSLLAQAEEVLGKGNVRLSGKAVSIAEEAGVAHGF